MNGITQWQDINTDYPLKEAGNFRGLFCDASFVMFDGFVPVLNTIELIGSNLQLTFTFDNGSNTFTIPISSVQPNTSFKLKDTNRVYGSVVFGPLINSVLANTFGSIINTSILFEAITVRTINSSNGVYSINGLSNDVDIALDTNLWFTDNKLYAVSVPDNLEHINTNSSDLYVNTDSNQLIDATSNSIVTELDKIYSAIVNIGNKFIGVTTDGTNSVIYSITQIPAIYLNSVSYSITSLAVDADAHLWAIAGSNILDLGVYPYSTSPVVYATSLNPTGLTYINSKLVVCVDGYPDYSDIPNNFSSQFYSIIPSGSSTTNTLIGTMSSSSSNHLPWLVSVTSINNKIYGLALSSPGFVVYSIDPISLNSTQILSYTGDVTTSTAQSIFVGGNTITLTPISPLKTINLLGPNNNLLYITGSNFITVTQQSNDTIVFSLPIKDENLNVIRTTTYV